MSETIDAIQDRISPARLVSRAREKVRPERTIRVVKANPVAAALLGVGAAALAVGVWMRSRRRNRQALVLGACTGIACWSALRVRHPRGLTGA